MDTQKLFWASVAVAVGLAACNDRKGAKPPPAASKKSAGEVVIDGSSTVYPITEAVAEEFRGVQPEVRVNVGISGTGGGFKRFRTGEIDICDASRPIKKDELEAARSNQVAFLELPIAYDGLSIVVHPRNDWAKQITLDELRAVFLEGKAAKTWKDVRAEWPDVQIKVYAPGTDSGTFDYFKEVVAGKEGAMRSDMSTSEDDNVLITGIAGDPGAIGFLGCAYYFENKDKLRALAVVSGAGKAVDPTPQTIESGEYEPFSRPLFIYVNVKSVERPEVDAFVKFFLEKGPDLAVEVGYVKLPQGLYDKVLKNYEIRKTGTLFLDANMEKVPGTLAEVYK